MRIPLALKGVACAALVTCTAAGAVRAGSVESWRAFRKAGWLQVDLTARDLLDARTQSTVESGLPGTCVYRIQVEDQTGRTVAERFVQISLQFDLWEDQYVLESARGTITLGSLAAADSAWSQLTDVRLAPLVRLQRGIKFRLNIEVAVQPLAAEDQARISQYVSQNSGVDRKEFSLDLGALLKRFVGKSSSREEQARFRSALFRIDDLQADSTLMSPPGAQEKP